jgi:hypothetical protein
MGTELVPYGDMEKMAATMAKSGMFGKTLEQMLALMLIAQAEGKHPAIAAQEYDVIKGRPSLNSRSTLARFQLAGGSIKWIKRTDIEASATFSHPQGGEVTITWDIQRAKQAGLYDRDNSDGSKNMYHRFPAQMFSARVVSEGVRAVFPACLSGMYTVEENEDAEIKNVTHSLPAEDAELQDVTDSKGELSPPTDPGEVKPKGDGTRGAMLEYKKQLGDIAAAKYPGTEERILTVDDIKDMNAEYHPGGRNLVPSDNDLDLIKSVAEKWQARVDMKIDKRQFEAGQTDAIADEGFALEGDK